MALARLVINGVIFPAIEVMDEIILDASETFTPSISLITGLTIPSRMNIVIDLRYFANVSFEASIFSIGASSDQESSTANATALPRFAIIGFMLEAIDDIDDIILDASETFTPSISLITGLTIPSRMNIVIDLR